MNNDQTMQWGIIGCARIAATAIIPGIKGSANGDVLAIASRELEKAKAYADRVLTERPIESPVENGVANMRVIDAVVQSAQTGMPVELS